MTEPNVPLLDELTRKFTAFDSFEKLVADPYTPTFREDLSKKVTILADAYDARRAELGLKGGWRPYRPGLKRAEQKVCRLARALPRAKPADRARVTRELATAREELAALNGGVL